MVDWMVLFGSKKRRKEEKKRYPSPWLVNLVSEVSEEKELEDQKQSDDGVRLIREQEKKRKRKRKRKKQIKMLCVVHGACMSG